MSVTVLLVEDDPLLRSVLHELLQFAGYEVVSCENGKHAVQQLALARIDLVITDISMPEMDGFELVKILSFEWPEVRVIVMSGTLNNRIWHLTKTYGVLAALEKPFSLEEMLKLIQACIFTQGKPLQPSGALLNGATFNS